MEKRPVQRHVHQERGDADDGLQQHQMEEHQRPPCMGGSRQPPARRDHVPERQDEQGVGAEPVDELHGLGIFEQVAPGRLDDKQIARYRLTVHQRPGVVAQPRIQPGDQPAEKYLAKHGEQEKAGEFLGEPVGRRLAVRRQAARHHHDRGEDTAGQRQVDGKPVLADVDAVDEARCHHPPADRPLQSAKQQQTDQFRRQAALNAAGRPEEQQGQPEHEADAARQDSVGPLPPEDPLEPVEAHALIDLGVFGNLLVLGEFLLPFRVVQRRDDTVDGLPLGDRQAGIGQPRRPADKHQRHQHEQNDVEPAAQQRPVGKLPVALAAHRSRIHFHRTHHGTPMARLVNHRAPCFKSRIRAAMSRHMPSGAAAIALPHPSL